MPFDMTPETEQKQDVEDDVCRVLRRAADVIRTNGLAKCIRIDDSSRMCAHGAISYAALGNPEGDDDLSYRASRVLALYLQGQGVPDWLAVTGPHIHNGGVAGWNNMRERTAEEVIHALESAALHRALAMKGK